MKHSQTDDFLAEPAAKEAPGVLVLHAWWGLNDTFKAFCTRLANSGFVAFAPDLYRGKIAKTIPEAEALSSALNRDHVRAEAQIAEAVEFLSQHATPAKRSLAVVGFSLGAAYALDVAAADPERIRSVVLFYGTAPSDLSKSRASYLGHFAENDEYEPKSSVDELEAELRAAGRPVTFHRYGGTGHWFFEPDQKQAYDKAAADLAWDRTLAFLKSESAA